MGIQRRPVQKSRKRSSLAYPLHLGFMTGVNFGFAEADPQQDGATRNAITLGVSLEKRLGRTFFFQPELSLVQRGVKTEVIQISDFGVNGDVKLDYLELTALFKIKSALSSQRLKLFFGLGPVAAVALSRQVEVLGLVDVEVRDRFQSSDLMVVGATGLEYDFSPTSSIVGQFRYHYGLIDIDQTENTFRTRGFQLLLGFQFALN